MELKFDADRSIQMMPDNRLTALTTTTKTWLRAHVFRRGQASRNRRILSDYSSRTRAAGIDRVVIVLSFDCDTPEDCKAALVLDGTLADRGIPRTYAVPGAMLLDASDGYKRLANAGAQFINHGARSHTELRGDRYESITFYNQMSREEVVEDIVDGHRIVTEIIGMKPRGFRAPHFGYFQLPHQREVIYQTARKLGYEFCSDTLPSVGLEKGPLIDLDNLVEIPLSGSIHDPLTILDSWNYLEDFVDFRLKEDYERLFVETVDFFLRKRLPAVLNYYVDPAHVINSPGFLNAIDHALENGVQFLDYPKLISVSQRNSKVA